MGLTISSTQGSSGSNRSAVSLLFREGQRPDAEQIVAFANDSRDFSVSLDPGTNPQDGPMGAGWLELLASGLTFDLTGLWPATAVKIPSARQSIALGDMSDVPLEAITLQPGPHIAASSGILPVIRTLALLAATLSNLDRVEAICWHPARSWCAPAVFRQGLTSWVEGGVFPGLILASLCSAPDGGLQSEGLALFTGQELRLEPELASDRAAGTKLALRLLDFLIVHGRLLRPDRMVGPDGAPLRIEPSDNGRFVRVWRD